ncbi:MAG: MATE family efflux transporter [Mogibacterium sp.]|nr:MATE family efflux transporter [Mogibacterium sp.]
MGIDTDRESNSLKKEELKPDDGSHQKRDSDILGTEPVHPLLLKTSAPLMVSMFVMALYNIVDSIYLGHYSTDSLTAVSYCFPFQSFNIAFGIGTAIGMSALLSRYLGAKQYKKADKVAHNGFILAAINYIIFFTIGCFAEPIIGIVTSESTNATIISEGVNYLRITQWLSIAPMIQSMFERLLQGTGKTKYIFYMQLSATLFNAVVDPILIFGFFGLPAMGAKGAALATVFGQILGCVLGYIFNRRFNKEIKLSVHKLRPHFQTMKEIYKIGIPSIVLQSVGAVMTFSLNKILGMFSDLAVTTFGVYFKLQSFAFMPLFGMNSGSVPIIAYNYGADRKDRLERTMTLGSRYGIGLMSLMMIVFWLFAKELMLLFDSPPEMVAMGIVALHTISLNFPFAGYAIMRGAAFQALGKSIYSMNISLVRQLLIIIPCAYIYARIGGVNAVWWAFPSAEVAGVTMSMFYTRRIRRGILSKMTPRDAAGNATE